MSGSVATVGTREVVDSDGRGEGEALEGIPGRAEGCGGSAILLLN